MNDYEKNHRARCIKDTKGTIAWYRSHVGKGVYGNDPILFAVIAKHEARLALLVGGAA